MQHFWNNCSLEMKYESYVTFMKLNSWYCKYSHFDWNWKFDGTWMNTIHRCTINFSISTKSAWVAWIFLFWIKLLQGFVKKSMDHMEERKGRNGRSQAGPKGPKRALKDRQLELGTRGALRLLVLNNSNLFYKLLARLCAAVGASDYPRCSLDWESPLPWQIILKIATIYNV